MKKLVLAILCILVVFTLIVYARQLQYKNAPNCSLTNYGNVKYYNLDQRKYMYVLNWYTSIGHAEVTVFMITLPFILGF